MKPLITLRTPCPDCGARPETFTIRHRVTQMRKNKKVMATLECPKGHLVAEENASATLK